MWSGPLEEEAQPLEEAQALQEYPSLEEEEEAQTQAHRIQHQAILPLNPQLLVQQP